MGDKAQIVIVVVITAVVIAGSWARNRGRVRRLTQPVGAIAWLYGAFLVLWLYVSIASYAISDGSGDGPPGSLCVTTNLDSLGPADPGQAARAGAAISAVGNIQACALHPGVLQWVLFLLTKLPSLVVWGWVLVLVVWRLIRRAARGGPFTVPVAATMRHLGWLVIGGSLAAGMLGMLGKDLLAQMLMTPSGVHSLAFDVLVFAPIRALVPVPLLIGAALLSFARIIRAGAVLDEEVKATV